MKENILIFNFEQTKARKLVTQLMMLKFKVKIVKEEEWSYPVGYLCGNLEAPAEQPLGIKEDENLLDAPMLVMAGMDGKRLNQVLGAIKKAGIGKIPYKAVVTEINQHWLPSALLEELKQEHGQMQTFQADQKPGYLHEQPKNL